jgi:DNA-binding IclR family transcriptional regulator
MTIVDTAPKGRYMVPALANGLALLALFTRDRPAWSPPEIAQELMLARATVFRLLQTLEATGYVMRDGGGRMFRLGPAVLSRGFAYLGSLDLVEVAQPILKRLRDDTGLSSHLAVRDSRDVVYVARFAAQTTMARFPISRLSSLPIFIPKRHCRRSTNTRRGRARNSPRCWRWIARAATPRASHSSNVA